MTREADLLEFLIGLHGQLYPNGDYHSVNKMIGIVRNMIVDKFPYLYDYGNEEVVAHCSVKPGRG